MTTILDQDEVPNWHRQEVASRLAEYKAGISGAGRDWSEIRSELAARLAAVRQRANS